MPSRSRLSLIFLYSFIAFAPTSMVTSQASETSQTTGSPEWYFAPRFWYFINGTAAWNKNNRNALAAQQVSVPTAGFSLGVRFPSLSQTVFTLTALHGSASFDAVYIDIETNPMFHATWSNDYSRTDVELLAQTTIRNSTANWIIGARVEDGQHKYKGQYSYYDARANGLSVSAPTAYDGKGSATIYSVKAGLGNFVPLSQDGTHRLFANAMGVAGIERDDNVEKHTAYRLGVDTSVGYQYLFNQSFSFDMRYRFLATYVLNRQGVYDDVFEVNHGPLVGLTYTWR